jgi:hypothetical protein
MCASGAVFWPIAARKSDRIDGDDVREPECAGREVVFQPTHQVTTEARTGRSRRCFEDKKGYGNDRGRDDG